MVVVRVLIRPDLGIGNATAGALIFNRRGLRPVHKNHHEIDNLCRNVVHLDIVTFSCGPCVEVKAFYNRIGIESVDGCRRPRVTGVARPDKGAIAKRTEGLPFRCGDKAAARLGCYLHV